MPEKKEREAQGRELTIVLSKIGIPIPLVASLAPKCNGHIRERLRRYQFPRHPILHLCPLKPFPAFKNLIVDRNRNTQARTRAAAHVHGEEGVLGGEAARQVSSPRDISKTDVRGEARIVEPFEEGIREDHARGCDDSEGTEIGYLPRTHVALLKLMEVARGDAQMGDSVSGLVSSWSQFLIPPERKTEE